MDKQDIATALKADRSHITRVIANKRKSKPIRQKFADYLSKTVKQLVLDETGVTESLPGNHVTRVTTSKRKSKR